MGVIKRLALSWKDVSFALVIVLAWLSASLLSCPLVRVQAVSTASVESNALMPSLGPIMVSNEDDDPESQEGDLQPCELPGARLVSPPSLTLSQITPPQSVSLSVLTSAQHPLRC